MERSGQSDLTTMMFTVFAKNLEPSDFEFFNGIRGIPDLIARRAEGRHMTPSRQKKSLMQQPLRVLPFCAEAQEW
jgi:hypothetical protein